MTRITTNGTLFNYRYNLMTTTNQLNKAMTQVMTQRSFSTYAENPAGATRAFKIHSSLNATRAQYDNNKTVTSKFETHLAVQALKLIQSIHIEDQLPARGDEQMQPLKGPLHVGGGGEVVEAVQAADGRVHSAVQIQLGHGLVQKDGGHALHCAGFSHGGGQHIRPRLQRRLRDRHRPVSVCVRLDDGQKPRAARNVAFHHADIVADRCQINFTKVIPLHDFSSFLF